MNIVVSVKTKWGKELFYPESEDARILTKFTGRPTLLKHQLRLALDMGWNVAVIHPKFNLEECLKEDKPKKKKKKHG